MLHCLRGTTISEYISTSSYFIPQPCDMTAFVSNPALPFRKVRSTTGCVDRVERRLGTVTAPTACARTPNVSRRSVLSLSAALAAGLLLRAEDQTKGGTATASAAATNVTAKGGSDLLGTTETNQAYGFSFNAPASGWTKNITSLSSGRSATIFLRDADGDSNISMVTTPVPGDFAKISSFGTIDGVMVCINMFPFFSTCVFCTYFETNLCCLIFWIV